METQNQNRILPTFGGSFEHGWRTMFDYFLVLLLVVIVLGIVTFPAQLMKINIDADDSYGKTKLGELKDGRQYIELSFLPSESDTIVNVSCIMTPSILFILGVFMPCFVAFFITLILIIVIILVRKRRKGTKPVVTEEVEPQGYENEDFYVPPPPNSK